ncbi:Alpha/Beta hydrolase protein [Nemania sp. FL0031]|nr:Alpha/Beta hydrolase protein [Nemania sp. FL0031]
MQQLTTSITIVQSTRPQTIGYGLEDSPVALLAWIYEKLVDWTDSYPWTDDEVCTWISIYWFSTAGPRAAVQLYYEVVHANNPLVQRSDVAVTSPDGLLAWQDVKVGLAHFPQDVLCLPGYWGHGMGNVVYEKYHEKGGHFAAWEEPDAIVSDLREMFGAKGGAKGAVKVKANL